MSRYSGAIAAVLAAGGLVLAYGVQTMNPVENPNVTPAGTATESSAEPSDSGRPTAAGYRADDASTRPNSRPGDHSDRTAGTVDAESSTRFTTSPALTTTPILRPAPDLPRIEWPTEPAYRSPAATSAPGVEPAPPLTTIDIPPIEPLGPTTPSGPTELSPGPTPRPTAEVTPEVTAVPTDPISVPTTDANQPEPTPELTAPPTVWSPPVLAPELSSPITELPSTPESAVPLSSGPRPAEPRPAAPIAAPTQEPQPGT